jgi:hypothetical protein
VARKRVRKLVWGLRLYREELRLLRRTALAKGFEDPADYVRNLISADSVIAVPSLESDHVLAKAA